MGRSKKPLAAMVLQLLKMTIIEDHDLLATKIGDCAPVKAGEEVWRIRSGTWDPHLKFSIFELSGLEYWAPCRVQGAIGEPHSAGRGRSFGS